MLTSERSVRQVLLTVVFVAVATLALSGLAFAASGSADSGGEGAVDGTVVTTDADELLAGQVAENDTERTDETPTTDTATGSTAYTGDGGLRAFDASTGNEFWHNEDIVGHADGISTPTVANGTVYAVGDYSPDDTEEVRLWAIDGVTGNIEWNYSIDVDDTGFSSVTPPTVVDGSIYFGLDGPDEEVLYAFDAATGDKEWSVDDIEGVTTPTVVDGTVYMTVWSETLHAFDADTGDTEWEYTDESVSTEPTVVDGTLYVGASWGGDTEGELHAIDPDTGDKEWKFTAIEETSISQPVVDNGTLYFGSSGSSGLDEYRLYAVSTASGEKQWSWAHEDRQILTAPTVAGDRVYLKMDSGHYTNMYAFDADTGDLEWTESAGDGGSVTAYDDRVYMLSNTCAYCSIRIQAHEDDTGDQLWHTGTGGNTPFTLTDDPENGYSVDSAARQGLYGHTETYETGSSFGLFEVTAVDVDDPVIAGDDLDVDVTVENADDEPETDDVELLVDDRLVDTAEEIQLDPGESWSGTLTYTTESGDEPEVDLTVSTAHDSETASGTVDAVPAFEVTITDTTDPVGIDEELLVDATVENTASITEDQVVTLATNDTLADSQVVELDAGESQNVTLNYTTESEDMPALEAVVAADTDEETTTVTVVNTTMPVGADVGDVNQDGEITIVDVALIQQHLAGLEPEPFDEELADVQRTGDVTIVDAVLIQQHLAKIGDPSELLVGDMGEPVAVSDDQKEVTVTLENVGDMGTIQTVELRLAEQGDDLDDSTVHEMDVLDVEPDGSDTVTFAIDTDDLSDGVYEYGIFTDDDEDTGTLTIDGM